MLKVILAVHVAGGSAALLAMFIPMLTRKGGRAHRRSGWIFVGGMTLVSVTALVLSAARLLTDPRPEARSGALFLFYIAILTGTGVSAGIRVLRAKERTGRHIHPWDLGLASLLMTTALVIAGWGIATRTPLFVAFSAIGLVAAVGQLRYWLRPPATRMHWWLQHMSSMLGSCIAATTAFLVVNAPSLGAGRFSIVVWIGPTLVGAPAIAIWTAYYRKRFAINRSRPNAQHSMPNAQGSMGKSIGL